MHSATAGHEKSKGFLSSRRSTIYSTSDSTTAATAALRGIHINISSDPFQHRIPPYIQRLWQESKFRKHMSVWKRRAMKRMQAIGWSELGVLGTVIFLGSLFILNHVGFFSGKKYQDWQIEHYNENNMLDEVDLLDKVFSNEGRAQTTAVLLLRAVDDQQQNKDNSRTILLEKELKQKIIPILEQLCQYDMFASFIIWNDDPTVSMTIDMIKMNTCSPNKLNVINARVKMGAAARYRACHQSKTPYCYFQDIPREPQQLRSTYANFLRSPNLIHGESSDRSAFINSQWRYCFSNVDLSLRTCWVDIESGTFIAKAMASHFLANYDSISVVDQYADMYFTVYMNQIPYQLEGDGSYSRELTGKEMEHMDLSLTLLHNDLEKGDGTIPLKPYVESSDIVRNARSSCKNDRCLFLTNKQVLPEIDLIHYNPTVDAEMSKQMHDDYMKKNQSRDFMYSNAVDMSPDTSWKSIGNIQAGDYIGLDLLMPMRTSLKYRFLVGHPYRYRSSLSIQISYDDQLWIKLRPIPTINCQNIDSYSDSLQHELLECRFIITETGYRYIRLESLKDHDFSYDVYDFSFSAKVKKDANGQLLDIGFDEDGIAFVEDDLIQ